MEASADAKGSTHVEQDCGMSSHEVDELEKRLRSHVLQLSYESSLFQRLMYKSKNQHRRCLYYRALAKVKRDLRLFEKMNIEYLLENHFDVIRGGTDVTAIQLLQRFKKEQTNPTERYDPFERLIGVSRLLTQMTEPITEAGLSISRLLGMSQFLTFGMTMLALLARIYILVQQISHDVVYVFNHSSGVFLKKQSSKLSSDGLTVFRDYYPPHRPMPTLMCEWDGVKFSVLEKLKERHENGLQQDNENAFMELVHQTSTVYHPPDSVHQESSKKHSEFLNPGTDCPATTVGRIMHQAEASCAESQNNGNTEFLDPNQKYLDKDLNSNDVSSGKSCLNYISSDGCELGELKSGTKKRVAFVPVNRSSESSESDKRFKSGEPDDSSEAFAAAKPSAESLFNILFSDTKSESLF